MDEIRTGMKTSTDPNRQWRSSTSTDGGEGGRSVLGLRTRYFRLKSYVAEFVSMTKPSSGRLTAANVGDGVRLT